MKMQTSHYQALSVMLNNVINELDKPILDFAKAYKDAGLSDKRFMWDFYWAIPSIERNSWHDDNGIYDYLHDGHIGTAIKAALKGQPLPSSI